MKLKSSLKATLSRKRWTLFGIPFVGFVVGATLGLADPARVQAQIVPIVQSRLVSVTAGCFTGCTPRSQEFAATDFGPFNQTADVSTSDPNQPGNIYSYAQATQDTTISPSSITGSIGTALQSRQAFATGVSHCSITFRIEQACSYSYSCGHGSGAFASYSTLRLTGPFGPVFNFVRNSGTTSSSGLIPAGEYTFLARLNSSTSGGSTMYSNGSAQFNLSLTPLPSPTVVSGPICNPVNGHRYYQLSTSGWLEAQAAAEQLGGDLVTINDSTENAWILSTFAPLGPQHKWIGLSAQAAPGTATFGWINGEPLSYVNWATNPIPGQGNFALMLAGKTPTPGQWAQSPNAYAQDIVGGVVEVIPCVCNWNADAFVDSADFFAFLVDFFAGNADLNCSGDTTSDDFFQFLTCFFNGCG